MDIELYFAGAVGPRNPGGTGSWGFVIKVPGADPTTESGTLPATPDMTNNFAEYVALGKALRRLTDDPILSKILKAGDHIAIRGDSRLVIRQLNGRWAGRAPGLLPLLARCRELLKKLPCEWCAEYIPREKNTEADALTREAYTKATGKPLPVRARKGKARTVTATSEKFGRDKPEKCRWCDKACEFLCDHLAADGKTCDAPMCADHRHKAGTVHVDYRDDRGRRRGRWDTIDFCPDCHARERKAGAESEDECP